jgi:hypothetical protein
VTWVDVLAFATLGVAFACGWRAGLVAEFFDAGSLVIAGAIAAWLSGAIASGLPPTWPLSEASRHLLAFWTLFLIIYTGMRALGWLAGRYPDWPGIRWVAGAGGGFIGAAKALTALFVILYVALFAQIDPQLHDTLRHSPIATQFDARFPPINETITAMTPPLYRLVIRPYMRSHRL